MHDQIIVIQVGLDDDDFGTPGLRDSVFAFEEELVFECQRSGIGAFEGNEIGAGTYEARVATRNALLPAEAIRPLVERTKIADRARVLLEDVASGERKLLWSGLDKLSLH